MQGFGAGFQAVGAYNQAKGQQAALRAEAQTQENNAQLSVWQAEDSIERGNIEATQVQLRGAQVKGSQRAAMAANGVDLGYGSALEVLTDTDYLTAMDTQQVQTNAAREAWGYRMQARGSTDRARAARAGADQVQPWLAAGTSLLGSATQAAGRWYGSSSGGGSRSGGSDALSGFLALNDNFRSR